MKNKKPDPIDQLLDRWSDVPNAQPHIRAEVWRRISAADGAASSPKDFGSLIDSIFRNKAFSFTLVAACLLAGLFIAEIRLSKLHQQRSSEIARSYVRMIDPLIELPAGDRLSANLR